MKQMKPNLYTLFITVLLGVSNITANAQPARQKVSADTALKAKFLRLCDSAVKQLNLPERDNQAWGKKLPVFYIDAYIVRALGVAYDLTGKEAYLNVCREWSDRMITFQEKMVPKGLYYMNYGRKPFETTGDCYNADDGSIAMGILSTAIRCKNTMEKKRYLNSAEAFAQLVLNEHIGPGGGIRNGHWHTFDGEWWCSTGIDGSMFFLLYNETGNPAYLNAGLNVINWLNKQDLEKVGPLTLKEQGPSLPMYTFESYSAGLPFIQQEPQLAIAAKKQVDWFYKWAEAYAYNNDGQWGSKFGGVPFHLFIQGRGESNKNMLKLADKKLDEVVAVLYKNNKPVLSQFAAFGMMSMAEKLSPGAIYRHSDRW